jgi:hypothetical protein
MTLGVRACVRARARVCVCVRPWHLIPHCISSYVSQRVMLMVNISCCAECHSIVFKCTYFSYYMAPICQPITSSSFYYTCPTNAQFILKMICFLQHCYMFWCLHIKLSKFLCMLKLQINKMTTFIQVGC